MEQTLGKRIVHHRKRLNLTQDQLAEKLGVTAQAVSKWENDQSCPDIAMLPKLAEIFGISIDELLGASQQPVHEAEVIDNPNEDTSESNGIHVNNGKWEFHYDAGRRGAIGFACWVLLLGALMLIDKLINAGVGFWGLVWPSFVIVVLGLFGGNKFSFMRLGFVLFGCYFLLDNLGLLPFDMGSEILWPALIILFGLGLLADALRKPKKPVVYFHHDNQNQHTKREKVSHCDMNGNSFDCENCFGDGSYMICSESLEHGEIENNFGSATIDLSGVQAVADGCHIDVECNFGEVNILIPRCYSVRLTPETAFGSVETNGDPNIDPKGNISMTCEANFGSVTIQYI